MANVNTNLLDFALAHKARLVGYENTIGDGILALWGEVVDRAEEILVLRLSDNPSKRYAKEIARDVVDSMTLQVEEATNYLELSLLEQVETEYRIVVKALERNIPLSLWAAAGGFRPVREATGAVGVSFPTTIPQERAREFLQEPINGKTWKERMSNIPTKSYPRIRKAVSEGIGLGESIPKLRRRIREVTGMTGKRAEAIARTEVHHVSNRVHDAVYSENSHLLSGVSYLATLDDRTCVVCGSYDRNVYYFEPEAGQDPVSDKPFVPQHPRCRCVFVPETRFKEIFGKSISPDQRASMFGPVSGRKTFNGWLRQQTAETQNSILGVKAGKRFRRGKLKLRQFVSQGEQRTLKQLEGMVDSDDRMRFGPPTMNPGAKMVKGIRVERKGQRYTIDNSSVDYFIPRMSNSGYTEKEIVGFLKRLKVPLKQKEVKNILAKSKVKTDLSSDIKKKVKAMVPKKTIKRKG